MITQLSPLDEWPTSDLEHLSACPVCGSKSRHVAFSNLEDRLYRCAPGKWTIYRCSDCRSGYLDPRPDRKSIGRAYATYCTHADSDLSLSFYHKLTSGHSLHARLRNSYFNSVYGTDFSPASTQLAFVYKNIGHFKARADRLMGHLPAPQKGQKLLEIGCGGGSFLQWMSGLGWDVVGVEPDPKAADIARRRGATVLNQTFEELSFDDHSFAGIFMHHLIEHRHDPLDVLAKCRRWLVPGGTLSLATPNFNSLGCRVFGSDRMALMPPTHLVLFTPASLRRAMQDAGFHDVKNFATSFAIENNFGPSRMLQRDSGKWHTNYWSRLLGNKTVGTSAAFFRRWNEDIDITGIA